MAVRKTPTNTGRYRVTFDYHAPEAANVTVCGEFNDWEPNAHPMKRRKDGRFSTTITLPAGRGYRFRYLVDGDRWENDWEADAYVPNQFGGDDSLVHLPDGSGPPGVAAAGDSPALSDAPEPNEPA